MVSRSAAYDYMCHCFDSCHVVEREGGGERGEREIYILRSARLEYNASTINFLLLLFFSFFFKSFFQNVSLFIGSMQLFTIKNSLHNDNQISSY